MSDHYLPTLSQTFSNLLRLSCRFDLLISGFPSNLSLLMKGLRILGSGRGLIIRRNLVHGAQDHQLGIAFRKCSYF